MDLKPKEIIKSWPKWKKQARKCFRNKSYNSLMEDKSMELKPCPFCGGKALMEVNAMESLIICDTCECQMQYNGSESAHIAMWNTRADGWVSVEERIEVRKFAEEMEKKLRENDHKGGWTEEDLGYLHHGIMREAKELEELLVRYDMIGKVIFSLTPIKKRKIIRECADIANFAMMIADNTRRLIDRQPLPPPPGGEG